MNQRNLNFDFLRVIAAFAVVCIHVSANVVISTPDIHSVAWWAGNIAAAFFRWCVPVFVMISGALLLSSAKNYSPIEFYKKRASRLLPAIIFWSFVYIIFREYTENEFDLSNAVNSIIKGTPYYHLWYIYMLVGLYLITPFVRQIISVINADSLRMLIVICFAVAIIASLSGDKSLTFLPSFLPFIGYFLVGYYLYNHHSNLNVFLLILVFFVCVALISVGTNVLFPLIGEKAWSVMHDYLNPLVVIMSLCVFAFFTKKSMELSSDLIEHIAPITLGIYLVHPLWLSVLDKFGVTGILIHPLIGIPVTTLLTFLLSVLSSALLARVFILRKTVC